MRPPPFLGKSSRQPVLSTEHTRQSFHAAGGLFTNGIVRRRKRRGDAPPGNGSVSSGIVPPGDPVTFVLAALVLIAVAAAASALPGLRAAHMDPVKILRN